MDQHLAAIAVIFGLVTTLASGGALFVSMRVSGSIANFRNELVKELDERYIRKSEHNQIDNLKAQIEENKRIQAKERVDGVEVELHRYRDDLDITLKGILAAIKEGKIEPKTRDRDR